MNITIIYVHHSKKKLNIYIYTHTHLFCQSFGSQIGHWIDGFFSKLYGCTCPFDENLLSVIAMKDFTKAWKTGETSPVSWA